MSSKIKQLYQWSCRIEGLLPDQVSLKEDVWLKENEILLKDQDGKLVAYLVGSESETNIWERTARLNPYILMSSLITNNTARLSGGVNRIPIESLNELGGKPHSDISIVVGVSNPEEAVVEIEGHVPDFLNFIKDTHDKYYMVLAENKFLKISIEYYFESIKKGIGNDEGFISAMICMESLFNEGSGDIKYKISHRAAFLLSLTGMDAVECFKNLRHLYDTRSSLVHGSFSKEKADRHHIGRYAKKCLTIFTILLSYSSSGSKNEKKKNLLEEIDCAMLDLNKRDVLQKNIDERINDFKMPVPRVFEKGKDYKVYAW